MERFTKNVGRKIVLRQSPQKEEPAIQFCLVQQLTTFDNTSNAIISITAATNYTNKYTSLFFPP